MSQVLLCHWLYFAHSFLLCTDSPPSFNSLKKELHKSNFVLLKIDVLVLFFLQIMYLSLFSPCGMNFLALIIIPFNFVCSYWAMVMLNDRTGLRHQMAFCFYFLMVLVFSLPPLSSASCPLTSLYRNLPSPFFTSPSMPIPIGLLFLAHSFSQSIFLLPVLVLFS